MTAELALHQVSVRGRLEPLDLRIAVGERVALLGASGAGKTTLLSLANGSLQPDQGLVQWRGQAIRTLPRRRRMEIGTLWQDLRLIEELTVSRNVNAGALGRHSLIWALRNLLQPLEWRECLDVVTAAGLEPELMDTAVNRLSGGQRQRVALARLLRQEPLLVLADEPLSALDPVLAETVLNGLLNQAGCLVSLHRPDLVHRFDRVIGLRQGRLVLDASTGDVRSDVIAWLYQSL